LIEAFDLNDLSFTWKEEQDVTLGENRATELWSGAVPGQAVRTKLSDVPRTIIISARLLDSDSTVLARYANWCVMISSLLKLCVCLVTYAFRPEPFKFIDFPSPEKVALSVTVDDASADPAQVTLKSSLPIKGVVLDVEGSEDAKWSDQAIDLVPGDAQVVSVWGLKGRKVAARYLGDGSA